MAGARQSAEIGGGASLGGVGWTWECDDQPWVDPSATPAPSTVMPARALWAEAEAKHEEGVASRKLARGANTPAAAQHIPTVVASECEVGDDVLKRGAHDTLGKGGGVGTELAAKDSVAHATHRPGTTGGGVDMKREQDLLEDGVCNGEMVGEKVREEEKEQESEKRRMQLRGRDEEEMGAQGDVKRGKQREELQVRELGFDVPTLQVCAWRCVRTRTYQGTVVYGVELVCGYTCTCATWIRTAHGGMRKAVRAYSSVSIDAHMNVQELCDEDSVEERLPDLSLARLQSCSFHDLQMLCKQYGVPASGVAVSSLSCPPSSFLHPTYLLVLN